MTTTSSATGSLSSLLNTLTANTTSGSTSGNSTTTSGSGTSTSGSSTTSSGGGTLSASGIGSGLDVSSIVTALVNARKAASQQQIDTRTSQTNNLLTGLSSLNSALGGIQTALSTLTSINTFSSYNATLSPTNGSTSIGTATTMSSAHAGTYNIDVSQLATAQKRASDPYATGTAVGQGTLTISVGSSTMNVAVSATNSLSDIASAINGSSSNPGVTATIVNGVNGQQLMLSSSKTGVANAFTVSSNATSSSGLQGLATMLNTAGKNEAQDAKLSIDGIDVTSASNAVSGKMDGVTINLTGTGTSTLTVAQDNTTATNAIQGFVDAYNSYVSTVSSLSSYDTSTGAAGVLLGDTTLTSVQRQIASVLSSPASGNSIGTLANLGITRNADGTLDLDTDKLAAAFQSNASAVKDLFTGTNGYATRLNKSIASYTSSGGIISTRMDSLNNTLTQLSQQQTALNTRMSTYQTQLQQQYTALDTLMSSLNNTSSYLTTALEQLTNSNSKN
ncbi:MAG TPA: flagellar filament capping protein FliD [Dyella sp.]|uniref:flagellar filament capping protein FliD n=1 Tax=Dyella sp. TaxID=1869338 RepID=UPI002D792C94|nr:flagellar filament capping protein FliD [Dyella sp.]HET6554911.1 flagellar filament capping protein FliD [Dyella sp.]